MSQSKNFEIVVPAGTYWLGDPCYSVPDADWMPLLGSCDYFNQPVGEVRGFKVYASGTAYGDGLYHDKVSNEYSVDAGLIGLVPVELGTGEGIERLARKIVITAPTTFGYVDGVIYVTGYASIQTEDEQEDESDFEDESESEYED